MYPGDEPIEGLGVVGVGEYDGKLGCGVGRAQGARFEGLLGETGLEES